MLQKINLMIIPNHYYDEHFRVENHTYRGLMILLESPVDFCNKDYTMNLIISFVPE